MDFSTLDFEQQGHWVHLEIDGNKLYWDAKAKSVTVDETEAPCRVMLRPASSNEVYKAFNKFQIAQSAHAQRIARANDKAIDKLEAAHHERAEGLMEDLIVAAVEAWENIYFDGEPCEVSPQRVKELVDRTQSYSKRAIRAQLFAEISEQRENFTDAA